MHEKLQEEMDRQERRLTNDVFKPPIVLRLNDIKRLLTEFDPRNSSDASPVLTSQMVVDDEGQTKRYVVSAETNPTNKRAILLNGLTMIKARQELRRKIVNESHPIEVNGRMVSPPAPKNTISIGWVDDIVRRWLNASLDGLLIVWNVEEGMFAYDAFEHKLFRAKKDG